MHFRIVQQIKIDKKVYIGPGSWTELTRQNLEDIARATISKDKDNELIDFLLCCRLFNVAKTHSRKLQRFQYCQLKEVLDFLYSENCLSKWLIKSIRVKLFKYSGPADSLADLTAEKFIQTEAYYERYLKYGEQKYLDGLIGVLFHRGSFDQKRIPILTKRFSKLPAYLKTAIYLNYTGCRNLVIKAHPNIWAKGAGNGSFLITNWLDNLIGVSGGALGDLNNVRKENIWIVLRHMDKLAKSK